MGCRWIQRATTELRERVLNAGYFDAGDYHVCVRSGSGGAFDYRLTNGYGNRILRRSGCPGWNGACRLWDVF